ncbi:MAG: DNA adenine methylase [Rhodothermaceae bacterium]|nr:DNA adenine methylase [Rhodothermaceae bacterium]MYG70460.1 DNA adenine methylase [Rhodothermaceae bacterium]MYJ44097.1 DNA adenine methylase [Rhodothermaceae bacterium]
MSINPSTLEEFRISSISAANVSNVKLRSPLRYPGGKTWLVPHIEEWLRKPVDLLIEPFAGGGIVSLTAVMDNLAKQALMVDLDRDISSFWRTALGNSEDLIKRIRAFNPTRVDVERMELEFPDTIQGQGFRTLVLNRTRRGGITAPGSSFIKRGENNGGICSRWYPDTLVFRLEAIAKYSERLSFYEGDGLRILELLCNHKGAAFFIDPPYTTDGGKQAGARLYTHNSVDHERIFSVLADSSANFLMTYDCSREVSELVKRYNFDAVSVEMINTNHQRIPELVITRDKLF